MSTAVALLTHLSGLGVAAEADRGALRLRPASAIPTDLLAELREHKADVLALLEAEVSVALPALFPPALPPVDEYRARLALAAADPERAGDYLRGEASVVPPVAAPPAENIPEPTPLPDDLVNRLAAGFIRPAPWQRMIDPREGDALSPGQGTRHLGPARSAGPWATCSGGGRAGGSAIKAAIPAAGAIATRYRPPGSRQHHAGGRGDEDGRPGGCLHPVLAVWAIPNIDADRTARCWVHYPGTAARPDERLPETGQCAWGLRCVVSRTAGVVPTR